MTPIESCPDGGHGRVDGQRAEVTTDLDGVGDRAKRDHARQPPVTPVPLARIGGPDMQPLHALDVQQLR